MADSSTAKLPNGATPKKLALIAVLGVVLIAVLYVRFGRSNGEDAPAKARAAAGDAAAQSPRLASRPEAGTSAATSKDAKEAKEAKEWLLEPIDRPQWKTPELAQVVRYDPFALPAAFPQPAVTAAKGGTSPEGVVMAADSETGEELRAQALAELQTKLTALKQKGVRVIIDGQKQAAAIVGERTIHVGDDLEGFTVKAIDSDGVVVERKLD